MSVLKSLLYGIGTIGAGGMRGVNQGLADQRQQANRDREYGFRQAQFDALTGDRDRRAKMSAANHQLAVQNALTQRMNADINRQRSQRTALEGIMKPWDQQERGMFQSKTAALPHHQQMAKAQGFAPEAAETSQQRAGVAGALKSMPPLYRGQFHEKFGGMDPGQQYGAMYGAPREMMGPGGPMEVPGGKSFLADASKKAEAAKHSRRVALANARGSASGTAFADKLRLKADDEARNNYAKLRAMFQAGKIRFNPDKHMNSPVDVAGLPSVSDVLRQEENERRASQNEAKVPNRARQTRYEEAIRRVGKEPRSTTISDVRAIAEMENKSPVEVIIEKVKSERLRERLVDQLDRANEGR